VKEVKGRKGKRRQVVVRYEALMDRWQHREEKGSPLAAVLALLAVVLAPAQVDDRALVWGQAST
jgi:hypothetical protein